MLKNNYHSTLKHFEQNLHPKKVDIIPWLLAVTCVKRLRN